MSEPNNTTAVKECKYCGETFGGMFASKRLREHNRREHGVQAA